MKTNFKITLGISLPREAKLSSSGMKYQLTPAPPYKSFENEGQGSEVVPWL